MIAFGSETHLRNYEYLLYPYSTKGEKMAQSWRPLDWLPSPCDGCKVKVEDNYGLFCDISCGKATAYTNKEAGADAILEALEKEGIFLKDDTLVVKDLSKK